MSRRSKASDAMPAVFAVLSLIGLVATAVSVARKAPEAKEALDKAEEEKGEELTVTEKVKTAAPIMAESIVIGALTATSIVASHKAHCHKEAIGASLLGAAYTNYNKLQKKAEQKFGKDKVDEIRKEILKEKAVEKDRKAKKGSKSTREQKAYEIMSRSGERFTVYEPFSNQYILTSREKLLVGDMVITKNLMRKNRCSLTDYVLAIGGERNNDSDSQGWDCSNRYQAEMWNFTGGPWVEPYLAVETINGKDRLIIYYMTEPMTQRIEDMVYYDI